MKKKYFTPEEVKAARRVAEKKWREKNRETHLEYKRKSSKKHPKKYTELSPTKRMLYSAACRARKKGIEFDLLEEDIQIPEVCPYLNIRLVPFNARHVQRGDSMSLDRIDNSRGYTKGNVEVISQLANSMKNKASSKQLLEFAHAIIERHKNAQTSCY